MWQNSSTKFSKRLWFWIKIPSSKSQSQCCGWCIE